jgi:hypothetical protein
MRTTERWLDIPGYVDCYQFSTLGRVRSLPRIDHSSHRRGGMILADNKRPNGQRYFLLCKRGQQRSWSASQLAALAWRIRNPKQLPYVVHLNGDRLDFRRANLRWASLATLRMANGTQHTNPYYGVTRAKPKYRGAFPWVAALRINGRRREIGYFRTAEHAAYAYDSAVKKLGLARPLNHVRRPSALSMGLPSLVGEHWQLWPGLEKLYRVSDLGRVQTVPSVTSNGRRIVARLRRVTPNKRGLGSINLLGSRFSLNLVVRKVFGSRAEHEARQKVRR